MGRAYLLTVIFAAVGCGLAELLLPDGDDVSGRAFGLLASLLVLGIIVAPITGALANGSGEIIAYLDGFFDQISSSGYDSADYRMQMMTCILEQGADDAERKTAEYLAQQFDLSVSDIDVELAWKTEDAEHINLCGVTVLLSGMAVFADPYAIEAHLETLFAVESRVVLG